MEKLRSVLDRANKLTSEAAPIAPQEDPFSCLFNKIECFESTEDPFEPTPIELKRPAKETSSSNFRITANSCIFESHQFEPIPLKTGSSSSEKRLSFSSLTGLDFPEESIEDCFDMVNSLWNNDRLLVSNF